MNLTKLRSFSDDELTALNHTLAQLSPAEILRWLFQQELGKLVQFTSFGISGMVITDITSKLGIATPIVFVDTLYHFDEVC
jgi:3'-phosphoadenosine 5'-phosphosulfate sulfotransferase (PAPS reductase)/FAD synthetase